METETESQADSRVCVCVCVCVHMTSQCADSHFISHVLYMF